jgi:aquaporin TIP
MNADSLPRKLVVEALGTFALCFMGIGAIILTQGQDIVAIAFAHGLAIGLMVLAVGHISGGHFNPAVSIGFLVSRRISPQEAGAYIVAQLVGAVLGAGALTLAYNDLDRNAVDLGVPKVGTSMTTDPAELLSAGNALFMEMILAFFLMFVIFGTAVDRRSGGRAIAGLAIGLTITMDIFAGGAVSGAAMNPARWFGPAVVQQEFADFWIWIVGPVIGMVVAAFLYNEFLMGRGNGDAEPEEVIVEVQQDPAVVQDAPRRRSRRRRR